MKQGMTEQKISAVLLSPGKTGEKKGLLQLLTVDKTIHPPAYKTEPINSRLAIGTFGRLPDKLLKIFNLFSEESMAKATVPIKQLYDAQQNDLSYPEFQKKELTRYQYDLFRELKPFIDTVKWYHSYPGAAGRMITAPCQLSLERPFIKFNVVREDDHYIIETIVELKNSDSPLHSFQRNAFFIEKDNSYYFLSLRDAQTLDWLETQLHRASNDQNQLGRILDALQDKYPVNRNELEHKETIEVLPQPRVLLSELNDSFLMLTPQWLYDGWLVEGDWETETTIHQKDTALVISRNKAAEEELTTLLTSLHPKFADQKRGYYYLSFAEAQKRQWFPKAYHQLLTSGIELAGMDLLKHFRYSQHLPETHLEPAKEDGRAITYNITVRFGKESLSITELQKVLWAGQTAVLLKDGSLGLLNTDWMQQYATLIKHGKVNKQQLVVSRWLQLSLQVSEQPDPTADGEVTSWWQRWQHWQQGKAVYPVPASIQATLRPYQQKGYEWFCLMAAAGAGGCLADDMGLGKTLQSICFITKIVEEHPGAQALVVCPASLIYNWEQELKKFAPHVSIAVYHGAQRTSTAIDDPSVQVFITSYGTLRAAEERFAVIPYKVVFIDESHNIKNPAAKITRAVGNLRGDLFFALSGTPVVNNTFDLYAQLNTVLPGLFGSREFFKREYADPIDRYADEVKQQQLQKLIAPFVLRRTKEQVATDLPEKTETILWCDMGESQRAAYEDIKEQIRGEVFSDIKANGIAKSKLNVLQGILKLRQICNSPQLVEEAAAFSSDSVKMNILFDELEQILSQHKVLVFSQFTRMLDLLAETCDQKNIPYFHFDGQTPPAQRARMVEDFQQPDNKTNLFLISLKAGNAGLTLTAADYVFLFDPWWNEAVQQQAINRTHRIGQQKNVFAYKMICRNSIEEKILKLQERKQHLASDLISADEGFIKGLSQEDVEWLFG
ncbi:MAG: DEAD/DEAH box helicase [Niabella sp.]|nr:DEAD/DEAH box helicase [Niabella sp.]